MALVAHGNVANSITTTIALVDGKFAVRCTSAAGTTIVHAIDILDSPACENLGFVVGQSIGPTVPGDLTLVVTSEAPIAIATASDNNATTDALLLRMDELESAGQEIS